MHSQHVPLIWAKERKKKAKHSTSSAMTMNDTTHTTIDMYACSDTDIIHHHHTNTDETKQQTIYHLSIILLLFTVYLMLYLYRRFMTHSFYSSHWKFITTMLRFIVNVISFRFEAFNQFEKLRRMKVSHFPFSREEKRKPFFFLSVSVMPMCFQWCSRCSNSVFPALIHCHHALLACFSSSFLLSFSALDVER